MAYQRPFQPRFSSDFIPHTVAPPGMPSLLPTHPLPPPPTLHPSPLPNHPPARPFTPLPLPWPIHSRPNPPSGTYGWVAPPRLASPLTSTTPSAPPTLGLTPAAPHPYTPRPPSIPLDNSFRFSANSRVAQGPPVSPLDTAMPSRTGSDVLASGFQSSTFRECELDITEGSHFKEEDADLGQVVDKLKVLVSQAEETVRQIASLVHLKSIVPKTSLGSCPSNFLHRMPSKSLFRHSLTGCSKGKKSHTDSETIASSLSYRQNLEDDRQTRSCLPVKDSITMENNVSTYFEGQQGVRDIDGQVSAIMERQNVIFSSLKEYSFFSDVSFIYKDAPAVVQVPLVSEVNKNDKLLFPSFANSEVWAEFSSNLDTDCEMNRRGIFETVRPGVPILRGEFLVAQEKVTKTLLPSRYWLFQKELSLWEGFPQQYSSIVQEVAMGLGDVKRAEMREWLLLRSPSYGLVLDTALANHIVLLLVICLRAVQREASMLHLHESLSASMVEGAHSDSLRVSRGDKSLISSCIVKEPELLDENSAGHHAEVPGEVSQKLVYKLQQIENIWNRKEVHPLKSLDLLESGCWLSSQLSCLYDAANSKLLVIEMYKHALECSARNLLAPFLKWDVRGIKQTLDFGQSIMLSKREDTSSGIGDSLDCKQLALDVEGIKETLDFGKRVMLSKRVDTSARIGDTSDCKQVGSVNRDVTAAEGVSEVGTVCETVKSGERLGVEDGTVAEGRLSLYQLAAAIAALQERASFEQYRNAEMHCSQLPAFQMSAMHEAILKRAEEERSKRPNCRFVLEHDGLIWHRSQQDTKKTKTMEEILAEERDYKRRRMSYRGKKVKRNPAQVLHDIIEGHMEHILAAGGIGCFSKRPSEVNMPKAETQEHYPLYRSDFSATAENFRESYHRGRSDFHSDDNELSWRREDSFSREQISCSKEIEGREPQRSEHSRRSSHYDSGKYFKVRSRNSYDHYASDEGRRRSSASSEIKSYGSSSKDLSSHDDDRRHSHGRERHGSSGSKSYDRYERRSSREHSSEIRYDRWESKHEEDRETELLESDEEINDGKGRHRSRHRRGTRHGST